MIKNCISGPKDLIALVIIGTYCLAFILTAIIPGIHYDEVMSRQYERIMTLVVGFYFGSHTTKKDELKEKEL